MPTKSSPVWVQLCAVPQQYPWLDHDEQCDVCVIGGGLTGALCALRTAEKGMKTVLVTAGQLGCGATANAMPCAEYDSGMTLTGLSRRIGTQAAAALFEAGIEAINGLEELAMTLGGHCRFARRDCLLYTDDNGSVEQFNREYAARRSAGFDCTYVSSTTARDVFAFPMSAGMISPGLAAEFDPYGLTHQCIERAVSLGAAVFENTKAVRMEQTDSGVMLETSTHRVIYAGKVIVASGSACADVVDGLAFPRTYFFAATHPLTQFSGWPGKCVIRSWDAPHMTFAASPDGRLCACGLDTSVVDEQSRFAGVVRIPALHEKRFADLEGYAGYLFPDIFFSGFEAVSAFRGCRSVDGLPVIGTFRGRPDCIFAACCGAGGALMGELASHIAAQLCAGEGTPEYAQLFSPERHALKK